MLLEEHRAADHREDRGDVADEGRIGDLGAVDRKVERPDVDGESQPCQDQGNGGLTQARSGGPASLRNFRPDGERRNGEAHPPGGTRKWTDVKEAHENARPGDDRCPGDERDHADAIGFFGADRGFCLDFPRHRFCATRFFAFGARPWRTNTRL